MKAPNGKSTNLTEKQWLQVRTKAFKEWFGDWENNPQEASKVVDKNGEPFVTYTGVRGNFNTFNSKYSHTASGGFFFTASREVAQNEGKIKEVFLNIKNLKEENSELSSLDLENEKYDGISYIYNNSEAFVVFNPNQIKSAIDNNGEFSQTKDNIYQEDLFNPTITEPYSKDNRLQNLSLHQSIKLQDIIDLLKSNSTYYNLIQAINSVQNLSDNILLKDL